MTTNRNVHGMRTHVFKVKSAYSLSFDQCFSLGLSELIGFI